MTEKYIRYKNTVHPSLLVSPINQCQGSTHNLKLDRLV
jgi:hypothetical protein